MVQEYKKFRHFKTSCGKEVIGGKSAEQNEILVRGFMGKDNFLIHTEEAGSPFCVILDEPEKIDLKETAVFCARYSKDWRDNKSNVLVHAFRGKDVYKDKTMKIGTFGVRKISDKLKVNKIDIEKFCNQTC